MSFLRFLYFSRNERSAIIILVALIIIGGVIYFSTNSNEEKVQQIENNKDFESFIAQLKNVDSITSEKREQNIKAYEKSFHKNHSFQKLKEGETIELNSSDTTLFKKIPGIGSSFAKRIVKYREILGGYYSKNQLKEVWGMDDYLYAQIAPYITLEKEYSRLHINNCSFEELSKHPYINYKQAQVIVDIRERKGDIESIDRLALLEEFSQKDLERLRHYLVFD